MVGKRLIDANAIDYENIACSQTQLEWLNRIIVKQPTVDAIEIVRCKDCKYWEKQKDSAQGCCLLSGNYPTGGWYCADGKRRNKGG